MTFQRGDVVRLVAGTMPIVIGWVRGGYCGGFRLTSTSTVKSRPQHEFVPYEGVITKRHREVWRKQLRYRGSEVPDIKPETNQRSEKETINMTTLYQTNEETPRFGTKVGVNSENKVVLEIKGTGECVVFSPSDITEVTPFTVDVKFFGNSRNYSYISTPGQVEKGDWVMVEGSHTMATVTAVDTKSKAATKALKGRKVVTAPFGETEDGATLLTG